ncbi:hypothetical protein FACS189475_10340 [Betaproteobacteria bacterium]|nr:hypothetical protein FACS189475_10340 [Betaproteobacteria bacterium]
MGKKMLKSFSSLLLIKVYLMTKTLNTPSDQGFVITHVNISYLAEKYQKK